MVYLDYSATTPVNKEVLDSFIKVNNDFIGNANSLHSLGINIDNLIKSATKQIADILNIKSNEIIYTSGSSEANNLAIIGLCLKYQNRGNEIITTYYEHSSVYGPLNYLEKKGFVIKYVKSDKFGRVDLNDLQKLITNKTILVSVNAVNSEIGILNDVNAIGVFLKKYPKCFYHVDMTQAIGKINISLQNIDMATFSAHKFYGLKGIGILYKKENIEIEPLIHGGKSTTIYRSGTPAHPLIVSMAKALRLANLNLDDKYNYVKELNVYLKDKLSTFHNVFINSNEYSIPHILNISVIGIKSETLLHALEKYEIFISTKSACSDELALSESVLNLTNDEKRAKSSIRISLSHLTTYQELNYFVECFAKCLKDLSLN